MENIKPKFTLKKREILPDSFPNRIFIVLELDNISKTKFYTDLNITRQSFDNWKKGTVPTANNLMRIATYLRVHPTWLLYGEIERTEYEKRLFNNQCKIILEFLEKIPSRDSYEEIENKLIQVFPDNQLKKCLNGMQTFSLEQLTQLSIILDKPLISLISPESNDSVSTDKSLDMLKYLNDENRKTINTIIDALYEKQIRDSD